jgi:hypothetical protein
MDLTALLFPVGTAKTLTTGRDPATTTWTGLKVKLNGSSVLDPWDRASYSVGQECPAHLLCAVGNYRITDTTSTHTAEVSPIDPKILIKNDTGTMYFLNTTGKYTITVDPPRRRV